MFAHWICGTYSAVKMNELQLHECMWLNNKHKCWMKVTESIHYNSIYERAWRLLFRNIFTDYRNRWSNHKEKTGNNYCNFKYSAYLSGGEKENVMYGRILRYRNIILVTSCWSYKGVWKYSHIFYRFFYRQVIFPSQK